MTQTENATVVNGVATTTHTVDGNATVGDFTLTGTYQQNNTYKESTNTATFHVRIATTITVDNVLANHQEDATFTAHVLYNNSSPVTGGQVQFKLAGNIIGTANVTGGTATCTYNIPTTIETGDEITATYLGNETYATSLTLTPATITLRTSPSILLQAVSVNRGQTVNVPITVEDQNGDPITTGQLQVYLDNTLLDTINISSNTVYQYTAPNDATVGVHIFKARYVQDNTYKTSESTSNIIVRNPTTISPVNVSANAGGTATLTVNVYDSNNAPVTEGEVTFTAPGGTVTTVAVGNNGAATTTVEIPASTTEGSTIVYTTQFGETNNYTSSSTSNLTITIRIGVVLTVADVTAKVGETVNLVANVEDGQGNAVNTGTVTFVISDS